MPLSQRVKVSVVLFLVALLWLVGSSLEMNYR